jgi:hypothetical protein
MTLSLLLMSLLPLVIATIDVNTVTTATVATSAIASALLIGVSPAVACLYLFRQWSSVVSSAKQREQQPHPQRRIDGSTNLKMIQVERTSTYFNLSTVFCFLLKL